jgi:hypothetical protein
MITMNLFVEQYNIANLDSNVVELESRKGHLSEDCPTLFFQPPVIKQILGLQRDVQQVLTLLYHHRLSIIQVIITVPR